MLKAQYSILREILRKLPVTTRLQGSNIEIGVEGLGRLQWKQKPLAPAFLAERLEDLPGVSTTLTSDRLVIDASKMGMDGFAQLRAQLAEAVEVLARENIDSLDVWGCAARVTPSGFSEAGPDRSSKALLEELYKDDFVAKEKKVFIVDYDRSFGSYMVSEGPERETFVDAAAQIASLAVGYNHPSKFALMSRPEIFDPELDIRSWDVYKAFCFLLRDQSKLPHVHVVNSGSEAVETALRACQSQYPDRRKIIAFEGSFHGRTLLALHATHSPSKRTPFEVYKDIVEFMSFPETKDASLAGEEPEGWLQLWAQKAASGDADRIEAIRAKADPVLAAEIDTLLSIRISLDKEPAMAVILEPMQCEGGDRYGTKRFFRALRVLTRAYDTPLVFDEVQTGYGLGGPFFWHRMFDLVTANGKPDTPDAVSMAKKSQVGVCVTRYEQDIPVEVAPASIYRGYLHALEVLEFDPAELEKTCHAFLASMQKALGSELFQNPRARGVTFAFDLPSPEIANGLVKHRFKNGLMFYPAGERTLRFRLMAGQSHRELVQIFGGIYKCFLDLSEQDVIGKIPTLEEWTSTLPEKDAAIINEKPVLEFALPWGSHRVPTTRDEYLAIGREEWGNWFALLVKRFPQLLRDNANLKYGLDELHDIKPDQLWDRYEKDDQFTKLDLLWASSRAFGHTVELLPHERMRTLHDQIDALEKAVYEPERQDGADSFIEASADARTIALGHFDTTGSLKGFCLAAPLARYGHLALVARDPDTTSSSALYSADLTVHPDLQGKGLGFRMKAEQCLEAVRRGTACVRSRNRVPQARSMVRLNRRLGAVVTDRDDAAYGGKGSALYQSLSLETKLPPIGIADQRIPALLNKITLGNFVSSNYIAGMLTLKAALPEKYRHVYLSSGRAEGVDKAFKALRSKRPNAKFALSFEGDYFGTTTACARSLGGAAGPRYFDWPLLERPAPSLGTNERLSRFEAQLKKQNLDECFGLFVEPVSGKTGQKEDPAFLKGLIDISHKHGIPVVFEETRSAFYGYHRDQLFCSGGDIQPDAFTFYAGAQLGVVACTRETFLDQPLMMISTWEGDEHSLDLLRDRLLRAMK